MRSRPALLAFAVIVSCHITACASTFVVFPKARSLPSPDGRYVVRNADRQAPLSEYVGTFHSLFLEDKINGRFYKLCDYVGVAAVGWSGNNFIVITQYVSRRTSRALVFATDPPREALVLDVPSLINLVPIDLRAPLRENDHLFVEAVGAEGEILRLRVWGYGKHDPKGFRWRCEYSLIKSAVSCEPTKQP